MAGGNGEDPRRAVAICENCGTTHSVRIGPEGEVRPIGTGQGNECTCGDGEFRTLSSDEDLLADVESMEHRRTG